MQWTLECTSVRWKIGIFFLILMCLVLLQTKMYNINRPHSVSDEYSVHEFNKNSFVIIVYGLQP